VPVAIVLLRQALNLNVMIGRAVAPQQHHKKASIAATFTP
tara:strand:+ start:2224 stop:2343 length:120 start_codon:yes stop_codon:yes gene_type:complete